MLTSFGYVNEYSFRGILYRFPCFDGKIVALFGGEMRGDMKTKTDNRKMDILVLVAFVCMIVPIACFHEPWLDEAQAWMIARECSLWEILFKIPHTEGHPPLWHLILAPFAKSGVPYELGIKSISIIISTISAGIVLFCAPFPRIVCRLLPFTYFFFYQYGVIARPYGMMFLALILAACAYPTRNEKPWIYVLCLTFLCLTSAYGIVYAGGICIVWLLEIWQKRPFGSFVKEFVHDTRFYALCFLLLLAVCLILEILPGKDTYTGAKYYANGMLFKVLFLLVALPVEALFGQCLTSYSSIGNVDYNTAAFVIELILGVLLWGVLCYYGRKRQKLLLLVVPVCLFAGFSTIVYIYIHHIGLLFFYLVFWYWVCEQDQSFELNDTSSGKKSILSEKDRRMLKKIGKAFPCFCCLIAVWWNVSASILEIRENYGYARGAVEFLRDNDMMDLNIMAEWKSGRNADGKTYYDDSNCRYVTVAMMPYLADKEIEHLLQHGEKPYYNSNVPADEKENKRNFSLWASRGVPDVLLGNCELEKVYGGKVSVADYVPVAEIPTNYIWKNLITRQYLYIYLRSDLLGEYHLTSLTELDGDHYIDNRVILPRNTEK